MTYRTYPQLRRLKERRILGEKTAVLAEEVGTSPKALRNAWIKFLGWKCDALYLRDRRTAPARDAKVRGMRQKGLTYRQIASVLGEGEDFSPRWLSRERMRQIRFADRLKMPRI
jgi:hypothetical protein